MLDLILYIVLSIINATLLCLVGYKFLQILQLSDYKLVGYIEWAKDTKAKYLSRIVFLAFLSFACAIVINACFIRYSNYIAYSGLILYVILTIIFISNLFSAKKKTPLRSTYRMNRLITTLFIVCAFTTFGLIELSTILPNILYINIITLSPILLIFLVPLAHILIYPFEELNKLRHINKAKRKLKKYPYLIKIGITGSYGKTSTKYILNSILSSKYNVCMSPHSFNTPMGLCKVVDKYLEPYHEVLIAEMGANACGDISFLYNMIEPKIGIITGVSNQHLRTFYSINNIKNTKFELVKSIQKNEEGYMSFNGDNETCKEFYENCKCEKVLVSTKEKTDIYAKDIKVTTQGTTFTLVYDNKSYACETSLIGKHNIQNILLATSIALKLNVPIQSIIESIKELEPVAHRLELKNAGKYTILDDSYNSSVQGYKSALEVLSLFEGKKIIVTPGLVELGLEEKQCNKDFGLAISKICDICIVVNQANAKEIIEGIKSNEESKTQIIEAINLADARLKLNECVEENACILFENDLPDNYT